tara:strand:- start:535 stop:1452 length:918 start_codon:yes stop_codon:yes gene_type:complete
MATDGDSALENIAALIQSGLAKGEEVAKGILGPAYEPVRGLAQLLTPDVPAIYEAGEQFVEQPSPSALTAVAMAGALESPAGKAVKPVSKIAKTKSTKPIAKTEEDIIPEATKETQRPNTLATYKNVNEKYFKNIKGKTLDFGAGLGLGSKELKADAFEPFPREGFKPKYTEIDQIPSNSYSKVANLNVLNVVPKNVRDEIVLNIGRVLKPKGTAIISTRGISDVLGAKTGTPGKEDASIILPDGGYQKGFSQPELKKYIEETLGQENFNIETVSGIGKAAVKITKKKSGGMVMRNNNYNTQRIR